MTAQIRLKNSCNWPPIHAWENALGAKFRPSVRLGNQKLRLRNRESSSGYSFSPLMVWIMPATHSSVVETGSLGSEACALPIGDVGDGSCGPVPFDLLVEALFDRILRSLGFECLRVIPAVQLDAIGLQRRHVGKGATDSRAEGGIAVTDLPTEAAELSTIRR